MTALLASQPCSQCGNALVPPILAHVRMEELELDTDYVCLTCGCTYRWMGNPPVLTMLRAILPSPNAHDTHSHR
jgi:hypothetical protein